MIVTGPLLTSSTSIRAPKTPCSTTTPSSLQRCAEALVDRLCEFGRRCRCEARTIPLRRVGEQRELADHERGAAGVEERAVEAARVVLEDAQPRDLAGESHGVLLPIAARDPE